MANEILLLVAITVGTTNVVTAKGPTDGECRFSLGVTLVNPQYLGGKIAVSNAKTTQSAKALSWTRTERTMGIMAALYFSSGTKSRVAVTS